MPVSDSLKRLLRIREMQEEQCGASLESALAELAQLQAGLARAAQAAAQARREVSQSARTDDLTGRITGLEEERRAKSSASVIANSIIDAEYRVNQLREDHHAIRVQRRQAEALVHSIVDKYARSTARKEQQSLDEWFRSSSDFNDE